MSARTTVVVSPRERYSPTIDSLRSLFSTVARDVPVILVDGAFPETLRRELDDLQKTRPFHQEKREWPLIPNEARNIGLALAQTEFVAFCDNDMQYEPGWLEALEAHADRTGVEIIAPLICIGPPAATIIHHAGGILKLKRDKAGLHIAEAHNLMNKPMAALDDAGLQEITDTGEFHAIFGRTDFVRRTGPLDERLITREQNDFALRIHHAGGRVGFERRAIVTYNAKTPLLPGDLEYHVFRWNHADAAASLDALEQGWGFYFNRRRLLRDWIGRHRRARIAEEYSSLSRLIGPKLFALLVAPFVERAIMRRANARRPQIRRKAPDIPMEERRKVLGHFESRQTIQETSKQRVGAR